MARASSAVARVGSGPISLLQGPVTAPSVADRLEGWGPAVRAPLPVLTEPGLEQPGRSRRSVGQEPCA